MAQGRAAGRRAGTVLACVALAAAVLDPRCGDGVATQSVFSHGRPWLRAGMRWRTRVDWRGATATMRATPDGGSVLVVHRSRRRLPVHHATGDRRSRRSRCARDTASPLFDGLFALAQAELEAGQGRRDHRLVVQRTSQALPVRVLRDRREVALRVDARSVVRGRPGAGEAGTGAHQDARCASSCRRCAIRGRAHGARYRRAGHRLGRQLADQHRPRGVVPRRAATCSMNDDRRVSPTRPGGRSNDTLAQDRRYAFDAGIGPVSRRNLVPRLARAELSARGPAKDIDVRSRKSFALSTNVLQYRSAAPGRAAWRASARTHAPPSTRSQAQALRERDRTPFLARGSRPVHELHRHRPCASGAGRELRPAGHCRWLITAASRPPERAQRALVALSGRSTAAAR